MPSEREKMLAGELYDPFDPELVRCRARARGLCQALNAQRRRSQEFGKPAEIGSDVWVGGGAILCPGVKIGARSVIGAGSVVTRNVPNGVLAAGNPCRVIRELSELEER